MIFNEKELLDSIRAIIREEIAFALKFQTPPKEEKPPVGRKWNGLYRAVGTVVTAQRKRRKKFISFDDLRAELLEMEDMARNKMFVKDGEEVPMSLIKQRLAPSQLVRQANRQPNLKGVEYNKAGLIIK